MAAGFAAPSFVDDDEALKKDLTAVIALHGLPCGQVVAVKVQAENDYAASCKDRNKYRVHLNAEGRVVVDKQKQAWPSRIHLPSQVILQAKRRPSTPLNCSRTRAWMPRPSCRRWHPAWKG